MGEGLEEKPVDSKNHKQVLCPDRIVNKWFQPYIPYRHLLHCNGVKAKLWCMRWTANTMVENDWPTQERELKLKLLVKTYQERGMRLSTFQYQHFKVTDNNNNNNNNEHISRALFHVKHAQLRWTSANTKIETHAYKTLKNSRCPNNHDETSN